MLFEPNRNFNETMNSNILLPLIFVNLINELTGIACDFQYIEHIPVYLSGEELERIDLELENHNNTTPSYDSFSCEENDGSHNIVNAKEESQESHEYEDIESSCQVRRRTIQPKALNNIYNKLIRVVNTESYVQSIHIEECLNSKESCNNGVVAPRRNQKYICRQKFVRITLKALSESNAVFNDFFYYPSHCVCELVTVKKKPRKTKPTKRCFLV